MAINNLHVKKCEAASETLWKTFCEKTGYATFFHTQYWAKIFRTVNPQFNQRCLVLSFNDGQRLLIPFVVEHKLYGFYKRNISMVAGTYGGFLADTQAGVEHVRIGMQHILKSGNWIIRENPFDSHMHKIDFKHSREDFTQCIDIKNGYDTFLKNTDACHRKSLRRARDAGMTAGTSENWNEWREYYSVYEQSMNRWKNRGLSRKSSYTIEFFKEIYNLEPAVRKLWVVKKNSEIASGIICFYWKEHAIAWHGSGLEKFFDERPNNLLYDTAIRDACDNGYRWFDCNPSGGYEGVIQFKKHLGAQNKRSRVIERNSLISKFLYKIKNMTH